MGSFAQSLTPQGPPPGPISNPDQDSLPSATLPGQPAQPSVSWNPAQPSGPANQTPDDQKQGMFHKLFSKLSGQDVQYDVDPSTGQMLAKPVQEKPGELFRNILAAGLMGSQGIDHAHGQNTFAQGLMAGAGAGIKESRDMAEKQDAARRDQAQQNYENQLKANKEKREDQQLSMQQKMNDVAVQEYLNRNAILKFQLAESYGQKDLTAVKHIVEQDKDKLDLFRKAGNTPFSKNIGGTSKDTFSLEEYQGIVADPSVKTAGYVPLTVGWDKDNKPLIQLFPPEVTLTKDVIQTLQSKFGKNVNIDKDLGAREGQKLEPSRLMALLNRGDASQNQREMSDKIQLIEAQTMAARAETLDRSLNAQKSKQDLKKGSIELQDFEDQHNGFEILRSIATGTPIDSGKKDSKGKPVMITIAPDNINGFSTSFKLLGDNQKKSLFSAYEAEERDSQNELNKIKTIKGETSPEYVKEFEHLQTIRNTKSQLGPVDTTKTGTINSLQDIQNKNKEGLSSVTQRVYDSLNLNNAPDLASVRLAIAKKPDIDGFDRDSLDKKVVDYFNQRNKFNNNQESQTETRTLAAHEKNIWDRVNREHPNESQEEKQKWYDHYRGSLFTPTPKPLQQ
jgi:hypothetical protein